MRRVIEGIGSAFALLTIVPCSWRTEVRVVCWFPLVGWVVGGIGCFVALAAVSWARASALLAAVLVVVTWVAVTRMMHIDGLADTVDGLFGADEPAERLRIMADSAVGAFGATAIVLAVLVETAALERLIATGAWYAVVAAPALGRLGASIALWSERPARASGLGASLARRPDGVSLTVASVTTAPLLVLGGWHSVVLVAVGVALGVSVPRVLSRAVGGITGDIAGASIVLVECAVSLCGAVLTGW